MKLFITYNHTKLLGAILEEKLSALKLNYTFNGHNEILFDGKLSANTKKQLTDLLKQYGIDIIEDKNLVIVDRIKSEINDILLDGETPIHNTSDYLADRLNYSYSYLSNLFSETTYTSIENYIILKKIDKAKDYIINTDLTLTEIAFKLHYSSVAHLSRQFKKTTGLTPSLFQKIIKKRKQLN